MTTVEQMAVAARRAANLMNGVSGEKKNAALEAVRQSILASKDAILAANQQDKTDAESAVKDGKISNALFKRLDLSGSKFESAVNGIADIVGLPDPVGITTLKRELDDGLTLSRVSSPLGVIAMIFEARPEAAIQIAALSIKSSNAVILKGGKEAQQSNQAIVDAIRKGLASVEGFPVDVVQLIATREEVAALLTQDRNVDLIIPRGSNELVRHIQSSTRIPVLGHADGICSVYVDKDCDIDKACHVVVDSKIQYPAACNAAETLLIHKDVLESGLPKIGKALIDAGVSLKADDTCFPVLQSLGDKVQKAEPSDFGFEFLDLIMAVKCVASLDEAVTHINELGSHHTDCIISKDEGAIAAFQSRVDSAGVYSNVSTRFADGFRYGFGAEVGVSTNKTHARGPVGLDGLVIYKYTLVGDGHYVQQYASGEKKFTHKTIIQPPL